MLLSSHFRSFFYSIKLPTAHSQVITTTMKHDNEPHDEAQEKLLGDAPNMPVFVYRLSGTTKVAFGLSVLLNFILASWFILHKQAEMVPDKTLYCMIPD